ncbi:MetQ/NlpA family ABC transporter substrate-binding protein [Herbaspirillum huttiense]|jgi:D-methionine transport system substrate-binding protein|uniref:Lipoprotein n=3 Tax=Herbaspirillum TaxID=963 RepID=A0ABU2ENA0_9BURK|nr:MULTISPECIES: MetQ/NlpA family ABC transporter substrate-binding protein [Herbaspirillum]MAF04589.1 MetQ/NlpA family lipoprotein [Herbaspirillum sp.]MBN9358375.1 MetQ/NlpA family ABC transporter substrate-binding protein [Herbaspirillum huttiense]MBO16058.1 MetQ/NlpA family lipoprotein [Herbaspirillum sp.]MCP3655893.1 MetQ/NlpA family ABC transporter substrate-binding protein [Herbaspirillum sp.]MCP3948080.1 MetQ/NlpA family ABC transporter substrate-binding protein [Herbaspirillum sp.]|tara:strand:+ start:7246 stop:8043 length:798 start_codon:yes stop_codon:yes gene_type:complete
MKRRQLIQFIAGLGLAAGLACAPAMAEDQIKMGVTAGPHAEIMEQVKKLLEKDGVQMKVIEFTDYIQPNAALAAGDLDANSYQHQPYLDAQIKDRGYKFVSVGSTITFPMGVYSKKIKSLNDLKQGARVGVPNDPTNGGRALLVLQAKGVIKLKADAGLKATPLDIVENPKKIKIIELDAAQLPRSLDDFDAAVINGNYAESAGLSPTKDAIAVEASTGPYANVIAVRIADKDKPWVAKLVKAYHSPEVKKFVLEKYKGSVITSW